MSDNVYKLSDPIIGQVAKLLQLAILSGTDVVDQLRTLKVVVVGDALELESNYAEQFEKNLESMLAAIEDHTAADNEKKLFN